MCVCLCVCVRACFLQCICPVGTELNPATNRCDDLDECEELGQDACLNGNCLNTPASFECVCPEGMVLDSTKRICIGKRATQEV